MTSTVHSDIRFQFVLSRADSLIQLLFAFRFIEIKCLTVFVYIEFVCTRARNLFLFRLQPFLASESELKRKIHCAPVVLLSFAELRLVLLGPGDFLFLL